MRSRLFPALILLLALSLAVGCRGASSTAAAGPAPIRIGHFPNLTHAPALLARSRGDFEKGFAPRKVEWHLFNAGPSAIEALFAGQLDLLYVGPGPAVNGFVKSAGREVRVVAGVTAGGAGLVVREGSGIADASQLAGRRVASPQAGNTQDIALRNFLLARGLGWTGRGGTVDIAPIPGAEQLTLFQKGKPRRRLGGRALALASRRRGAGEAARRRGDPLARREVPDDGPRRPPRLPREGSGRGGRGDRGEPESGRAARLGRGRGEG